MITVDQVFDAIPKELLGKDDLLVEVSERYIRGNEEDPGVDALVWPLLVAKAIISSMQYFTSTSSTHQKTGRKL